MTGFTSFWNMLMSIAAIGGMAISLMLVYALILPRDAFSRSISSFVNKNILVIGFLVPLAAIIGSLVYSEIIGYPPCMLCWYARVAFYPQAILFAIALAKKSKAILDYALGLTIFGLIVTLYHSIIQITGESVFPCAANGVSCVTRQVYEFGFITIPLMGFVGFTTLFLSFLIAKRALKTSVQ